MAVSELAKVDLEIISKGIDALNARKEEESRSRFKERLRKGGNGVQSLLEKYPQIESDVENLMDGDTLSDPTAPLKWTLKSFSRLAEELRAQGIKVTQQTIKSLLKKLGYDIYVYNRSKMDTFQYEYWKNQYNLINQTAKELLQANQPVIAVSCRKMNPSAYNDEVQYGYRLVGIFANDDLKKRVRFSYKIKDILDDDGYYNEGINCYTAAFILKSIRSWWDEKGKEKYKDASVLYIICDNFDDAEVTYIVWDREFASFSKEINKTIKIAHLPLGISKWNKTDSGMSTTINFKKPESELQFEAVITSVVKGE